MLKKIVVASKNPVKISAVTEGFKKMFPQEQFEFVGVSVPSGVATQPFSDAETFLGAQNRAQNALAEIIDAEFYVGIEGGVEEKENEIEAFAWVYIQSGAKAGKARTSTFFLPQKVVELLRQGKELGEVDDIVFGIQNSKEQMGAVGILTGNIIDRSKYYTEAVVLALIPFKNPDLY